MLTLSDNQPFITGLTAPVSPQEPYGFAHSLARLALFSAANLAELAARYSAADAFVASGAQSAKTAFYAVEHSLLQPAAAIRALSTSRQRVLLKRPENYDPAFRALLAAVMAEIVPAERKTESLARVQSSILISSAQTITPFHFDPEVSFFFQICGPKQYHLYSPAALSESELEAFFMRGVVDIGQVDLAGRKPEHEHIFELDAGKGMYQPRNSPHWVQTGTLPSISYVVSYETAAMRRLDRVRSCNYYLRRIGLQPSLPGAQPGLDALKCRLMNVIIPTRNRARALLRNVRSR